MSHVPQIRRARGYRLYASNERRLLDCYQEGGRALLGHRPGKLIHDTKNVLERGMLSAFPSAEQERARRAVLHLLAPVTGASGLESFDAWFLPVGSPYLAKLRTECTIRDLAFPDAPPTDRTNEPENSAVPLWRPWLPADSLNDAAAALASHGRMLVRIPLPSLFLIEVVLAGPDGLPSLRIPPIPEPVFKAVSVVCGVLQRQSQPQTPGVPGFRACGPYLWMNDHASLDHDEYARRFSEFLDNDILISPDPAVPSIMPAEYSDGELKLLRRASAAILGAEHGN